MPSTARLEARISSRLHAMLKTAAVSQGRTMTDFVTSALQQAVQQAMIEDELHRLSLADQQCFARALLTPAAPTVALKRAFARHKKQIAKK